MKLLFEWLAPKYSSMYRPSKIDHVACENIKDNNLLYRLLKLWDQYWTTNFTIHKPHY